MILCAPPVVRSGISGATRSQAPLARMSNAPPVRFTIDGHTNAPAFDSEFQALQF